MGRGAPEGAGEPRERRTPSERRRELALGLVGAGVWYAGMRWLPTDGWGLVVRGVMTVLLVVALVLWLAYAVQEFRRGYTGADEP